MKKTIIKLNSGYTLIELLAVIVVMIIVGIIAASILVSSLRGTNKTNIVDEVRQNGNTAITQMAKMIEFAQKFEGVSVNGTDYVVDCTAVAVVSPSPTPAPVEYKYLKLTAFDGGTTVFSCGSDASPTLASNGAILINTDKVSVTSCHFSCNQSTIVALPIVDVYFVLSDKNVSEFAEKRASIPFETTVVMRNLR